MSCEPLKPKLGPYLDDELSAGARAHVERHLAACPACRSALAEHRALAEAFSAAVAPEVPEGLWPSIVRTLDHPDAGPRNVGESSTRRSLLHPFARRPWTMAAVIVLLVGMGIASMTLTDQRADASTINFAVLLDALPHDAEHAFRKFLALYDAQPVSGERAARSAPRFRDKTPSTLPGGFHRTQIYLLRFGDHPGVAACYDRDGEFLGTVFHTPVNRQDYGTHRDYPCMIGKHRGRRVSVGAWRLVHLTNATACHCVLSKLDEKSELPAVIAAIAPGLNENPAHSKHH